MFERQRQKAGDSSQQIQAETAVIIGIDEKRAREIVDEKIHEVIKGYSQEAHAIAERRIKLFGNDLIPKLVKASLLDELKDPSIQILLSETQKTAASTERLADYSLLSELLIHRVKKGNDRYVRAGISRAVKIVAEISDEALLGLTVSHSAFITPTTGNVEDGIKFLAHLFDKVLYDLLPTGNKWLEHLDILDALRVDYLTHLKKFDQFYSERLSGYIDVGIDKATEDYQTAIKHMKESNLPSDILCDHELRPGYARLRLANIDRLDLVTIPQQQLNGKIVQSPLSNEQKQTVRCIYGLYSTGPVYKKQNITRFFKLCDKYDSLKKLRNWWDYSISRAFTITSVGKVLAHANAQRYYPTISAPD